MANNETSSPASGYSLGAPIVDDHNNIAVPSSSKPVATTEQSLNVDQYSNSASVPGVPFPVVTAPVNPINPLVKTGTAESVDSATTPVASGDDLEKKTSTQPPAAPPHTTTQPKKKGMSFLKKRKAQDEAEKKDKEKEDEANAVKPVSILQLFRFSKPHERVANILALFLAAAAGSAPPLMSLIFGRLSNDFTNYGRIGNEIAAGAATPENFAKLEAAKHLLKLHSRDNALYLVAIGGGMFVCTWSYMFIWNWTGEVNAKRVREKYLHATLRQDIAYFDDLGAGEVATRIQTDCHLVQEGTSEKIAIIVTFASTFITGFVLAYARGWKLALALSSILPFIMICGGIMQILMKKHITNSLEEVSKAGGIAEEVIASIRTVHAFGTDKTLRGRFNKHIERMRKEGKKSTIGEMIGLGSIFFAVYGSYGLAFHFGGKLVANGEYDVGIILNVFMSIVIGSFSLSMMTPELQAVTKACSAAAKLFATIDRVPPIDSADPGGLKPDSVHGTITFEDVKFHYPSRPNVPILKGLTTAFDAGKTVALVGASGSGKSTVIGLIERFYDPISGVVKLDGVNIKDINLKWLRQQIGLVSQEPTLFGTTVRGNVEHGLIGSKWEHASEAEKFELVKKACIDANAHDFILKLPKGYDTHVGERGMLLSGGQKQRVAIARAIVSDPRILLLDEATSALDTQSEGVVQDALDKAAKGRTTITIAHRLSTIRDADLILVMGGGEILEQGTHSSLLSNENGPYALLVANQKLAMEENAIAAEEADEIPPSASDEALAKAKEAGPGSPLSEKMFDLRRATTGRSLASVALEKSAEGTVEKEAAAKFYWSYYSRLFRINGDQKVHYFFGLIGAIASGMVYPALAIIFGKALEAFQILDMHKLRHELDRNALWYFITAILASIAITTQVWGFSRTGWDLSSKLRMQQFEAVCRHDISWFDEEKNSTGSVTSDLSEQPQRVQGLFGVTMGTIIQSITTLVGGCIIGFCYGPLLALIAVACIPLLVSAGFIRLKVVVLKDERLKAVHAESAQLASEAASAVRTVASLTREDDMDRLYSQALQGPMKKSIRGSLHSQALYALSQSLSFPVIALTFYVGCLWLISGRYSTAQFYTVLMSVVFASIQAGNVFNFVPDASKTNVAATAIFHLLDYKPKIDSTTTEGRRVDPSLVKGHIRLEDVHFRYPTRPDVRVLRDLTLDVPPGTYVALVGPSGCGKSTTIQMLERFYDPLIGKVTLDGVDIRDLNVASYRSQMALVSQEPTLYAGSVRFNILLGANKPAEEVTEEELVKACKDANIYDFIMSLPNGFETEVGGKGSQLSGGQKQRIAIARALIRNPKVLLLDEATSALDSQSERVVQDALDQAAKGRTTIAIAHRLSTIQKADIIYCFAEGRVAEKGTHAELIAKRGAYYELVQMQNLSKQ